VVRKSITRGTGRLPLAVAARSLPSPVRLESVRASPLPALAACWSLHTIPRWRVRGQKWQLVPVWRCGTRRAIPSRRLSLSEAFPVLRTKLSCHFGRSRHSISHVMRNRCTQRHDGCRNDLGWFCRPVSCAYPPLCLTFSFTFFSIPFPSFFFSQGASSADTMTNNKRKLAEGGAGDEVCDLEHGPITRLKV